MRHWERELSRSVEAWDARGWPRPEVLVVSGSGLAVELGAPDFQASFAELLPFPVLAVPGHQLQVELVRPHPGVVALSSRGRLHAYQGYEPGEVVYLVRLAALLGARTVLLTNAAGGLEPTLAAGDLVLLADQINLTGLSPLRGNPPDAWGPRFPDMSEAYDPHLREVARREAARLGVALREGVYVGLPGPAFETPAEVRMLRALGADVVGMSTVLEVIAARHLGMRCLGISLVANPAAGITGERLDHEDVLAAGARAGERLRALLLGILHDAAAT